MTDMTPYDMLRSILGQSRSDDEIESALAANGYDLGATVAAMMDPISDQQDPDQDTDPLSRSSPSLLSPALAHVTAAAAAAATSSPTEPSSSSGRILVGKSMAVDNRPATPLGQKKSTIICKFYLSTGQCLRADCRFSHDMSNHLCK